MAVVKDKPCFGRVVDSVRKYMTVHATTDTLTATDKASDNLVDMDPEEPFVPAPTVSDIYCLADKVLIHAGRIAVPECVPVPDTFVTSLICRP